MTSVASTFREVCLEDTYADWLGVYLSCHSTFVVRSFVCGRLQKLKTGGCLNLFYVYRSSHTKNGCLFQTNLTSKDDSFLPNTRKFLFPSIKTQGLEMTSF